MTVDITNITTHKRLITAGNDEVWYEMAAGDMIELTDANGDINTSDQLNMFEAYQKVFVVNGTKLKVADFVNTKLVHAELTTPHAKGDILTQDTTHKMVVDFTNTAKTATYGYVTAGTFDITNEVTGSGSGTAFTPSEVTNKPHWYDWTVYQGDVTTYGAMPAAAYLGCLYRGRCVLSANPDYPHQWYMSKIGDPWNWLYSSTDPLTAVAGNNADAGEIGDIIRALIPYKDDYLIFGCASTIWVLTGDPAAGGSIDGIDLTVGIFGANSWCFDGDGNLYFYGTGGIYKVPLGFRSVENLTDIALPNLIGDEDANPTTHRITMAYDRKRHGLLTCITKLSDGTNSNYWYDLKLKGFFPEDYPNECGPYSLFYYAANDNDYADLLVGCKDGYIRKFGETIKNDATGASSTDPISSYVVLPIEHLAEDDDKEGKLTSLTLELAGGGAGGDFSDTDAVTYRIYKGDDAETVLEKTKALVAWVTATYYAIGVLVIYDSIEYRCIVAHTSEASGATHEEPDTNTTDWETVAFSSGSLTGTGRQNRIRPRMRGAYAGLKLSNSAASSTFGINKVYGNIVEAGSI